MGISIAKNTVNSLIQNTQKIIGNYENICTATGNDSFAQFSAQGCNFDNDKIYLTSTQTINQTCIQQGSNKESMLSDVRQSMNQSAQAITQSFGFPSLSISESFINDSIQLGENITNNYLNKCVALGQGSGTTFNCKNSTFKNSVIDIQSYQKITQKCTQDYINNDTLVSKLVNTLSQSDVAQQQNTFAIFGTIIIVIIVVIAYAGISLADNPLVEWGIVILVLISVISSIVYTISARKNGHYPYNST